MDQILYWNDVALEANRKGHTDGIDKSALGPTLSSRALAIVHLAMYDAYVGVAKTFGTPTQLEPYLPGLPVPPTGASADSAIAAAACSTLSRLYTSQKDFFVEKYKNAGLSETGYDAGQQFGMQVAHAIWEDRKDDPGDSDVGYTELIGKGKHHKDPNNPQPINAPFYGARSKCFAVGTRFTLNAPYALSSNEYRTALRQVRAKGIQPELMGTLPTSLTPSRRTADETLTGIYWGYDGAAGLGTPPRLYNQIVKEIAIQRKNTLEQNVLLFALVNVAMADAGILAWDQKYIHNFWRPVIGIREHDESMGITGVGNTTGTNEISSDCDPLWLPLGAPATNRRGSNDFTPPFPAYPSGHATFGAAALHMTRLFYKGNGFIGNRANDDVFKDGSGNDLTFVSDEFNGSNMDSNGTVRPKHTRQFPGGLWQMIIENGFSRVYLGVHWSFDSFAVDNAGNPDLTKTSVGGVPLGLKIAEDIYGKIIKGGFNSGILKSTVPPRY